MAVEKVVENENDMAKMLTHTDKLVMANQPDIVVVDNRRKEAIVIDIAVPSDSNTRKKEFKRLEKYRGLKEELEKMWKMKATVALVVIGTLRAMTPYWDWLQQIHGQTSEISVQTTAVLGTAKVLYRTLKLPGLW